MLLRRISKQLSAGSEPLTSPLHQRGCAAQTPAPTGGESPRRRRHLRRVCAPAARTNSCERPRQKNLLRRALRS